MFLLAFKLFLLVFHSNTKKETNQSPFLNLSFKYGDISAICISKHIYPLNMAFKMTPNTKLTVARKILLKISNPKVRRFFFVSAL